MDESFYRRKWNLFAWQTPTGALGEPCRCCCSLLFLVVCLLIILVFHSILEVEVTHGQNLNTCVIQVI